MDSLRLPNDSKDSTDKSTSAVAAGAEQLWKFLDHMAENDPEQYTAFIEQQKKNNAAYIKQKSKTSQNRIDSKSSVTNAFQREPRFKISSQTTDNRKLVVFFASDTSVDKPHTAQSLPMKLGCAPASSTKSLSSSNQCLHWSVLFHSSVFDEMRTNKTFQKFAIEYSLQQVEREISCAINRDYVFTSEATLSDTSKVNKADQDEGAKLHRIILPFPSALNDDKLLKKNSEIVASSSTASASKNVLIQPVQQTPEHSVTIENCSEDTIKHCIIVSFLPLVESMADIQLDINTTQLILRCEDYLLDILLPNTIIAESTRAKFERRHKRLTVKAQLQ